VRRSEDRILTTHVGSLPRSPDLLDLLVRRNAGQPVDEAELERRVAVDMDEVVRRQLAVGIDVGNDGELPRIGFSFYVKDRMVSGFGGESMRGTVTDFAKFPGYAAMKAAATGEAPTESASIYVNPQCVDRIVYDPGLTAARGELRLFRESLERAGGGFAETFVNAATPGIVSATLLRSPDNPAYRDDGEYLHALARELKKEYGEVVAEGHVLQLDAPDLALERQIMYANRPLDDFLERVRLHVDALNEAIAGLPPERVRLHVCWGNWDGPHVDDVELEPLLPLLLEAKVGALSLACANPRHQHDWKRFRETPLPDGVLLIPGVIDVTTNYLEHPEVVADRICVFAEALGDPTRVIASTDCGFSTFAGYVMVAPDVVWKKLEMLVEGAAIASRRLFG
jgi:5-methyltetrahydropteroyltriglutamate--homocysteine methyltransferase